MRYCAWVLGLLFMLTPCTLHADLSGTVTDTDGNPIAGALVTATNESDPDDSESVYTDESGFYKIIATTSGVDDESPLPLNLSQNYPNPFNPSTTIPFSLDAAGHVSLTVYNIMGQRVRTLVDGYRDAGTHTVTWDGLDSDGAGVGAGLYLYRLQCGTRTVTRKMLLIDGGNGISTEAVPIMRPAAVEKSTVRGESIYKITVTKDGYQPCFRHGVYIIVDADETINLVTCSSAIHEIHGIPFVSIPGGTFRMGDIQGRGKSDELPVHDVILDGFEMSIYEITNAQYAAYLNAAMESSDITIDTDYYVIGTSGVYSGKNYYNFDSCCFNSPIDYINDTFKVDQGKENHPTKYISWYGAKAFALYYGFDLPTEAEWEYSCRAGTETLFYSGNDMDSDRRESISLDQSGWYNFNSDTGEGRSWTHEVGQKISNAFGLFDMHGNIFEWCNDWYGNYPGGIVTNPIGPTTGSARVIRGGNWNSYAEVCRSAFRYGYEPWPTDGNEGFRVVRRP